MNVVNVENTTLLAHERQLAVAPKSTLPYANLSAKVYHIYIVGWGWFMVFKVTFYNISIDRGGQFYRWRKLEKTTDLP
jgi:hypothetical protein